MSTDCMRLLIIIIHIIILLFVLTQLLVKARQDGFRLLIRVLVEFLLRKLGSLHFPRFFSGLLHHALFLLLFFHLPYVV